AVLAEADRGQALARGAGRGGRGRGLLRGDRGRGRDLADDGSLVPHAVRDRGQLAASEWERAACDLPGTRPYRARPGHIVASIGPEVSALEAAGDQVLALRATRGRGPGLPLLDEDRLVRRGVGGNQTPSADHLDRGLARGHGGRIAVEEDDA